MVLTVKTPSVDFGITKGEGRARSRFVSVKDVACERPPCSVLPHLATAIPHTESLKKSTSELLTTTSPQREGKPRLFGQVTTVIMGSILVPA